MSIIRIRRGTTTQWNASTKILQAGELGLDTTLNKVKTGNGVGLWSTLPYINVLPSELTELAQDAVNDAITTGTGITKVYNDTANTITLAVDSTIANKTYVDTAVSGLGSTVGTTYIPVSQYGNPDGVATLDENGKIPISELGNLIDGAPNALDTLNELAAAINDDSSYAATITTALGFKAPLASPTFTGTVAGIDKTMVGLTNVDNTTDALKPVSAAQQIALDLKLNSSTAATTYLAISETPVDYYISNSGSGAYFVNGVSNGLITFEKGKKYRIHINASGHPFWIQTVSGAYSAANVYSAGITNGGAQLGHILVELPQNAPDNLYYACEYHSSMQGSISVQSQDAITINSKSANYTILPIDSGRLVEMSAGGTLTITDSSSFPIGFTCDILQTGASQVTIAGTSFTPNATPGLKLRTQWSSATLIKRALNSWVVLGDLSA